VGVALEDGRIRGVSTGGVKIALSSPQLEQKELAEVEAGDNQSSEER
jgi:hypothetical protein